MTLPEAFANKPKSPVKSAEGWQSSVLDVMTATMAQHGMPMRASVNSVLLSQGRLNTRNAAKEIDPDIRILNHAHHAIWTMKHETRFVKMADENKQLVILCFTLTKSSFDWICESVIMIMMAWFFILIV